MDKRAEKFMSMTLTELRKIVIKCKDYKEGGHCRSRITRVCFLWENRKVPDYCPGFKELANISVAQLDRIWESTGRKKGQKTLLKQAIIQRLLDTGSITQKEIIKQNLITERMVKYHWPKIMQGLGLKWKRGDNGNYRYKIYRATFRKKRELKRVLKQENNQERRQVMV